MYAPLFILILDGILERMGMKPQEDDGHTRITDCSDWLKIICEPSRRLHAPLHARRLNAVVAGASCLATRTFESTNW